MSEGDGLSPEISRLMSEQVHLDSPQEHFNLWPKLR